MHLLATGEWPEQVDHVNGVRSDNRPENLRAASHDQNCMNRKPMGAASKGCYWQSRREKWVVQIGAGKRRRTVGYFDTLEEAAKAYAAAAERLHGEFARTS